MANKHQLLLNHLMEGSDPLALAHYLNILSEMDIYGGVRLTPRLLMVVPDQLDMLRKKLANQTQGNELYLTAQEHFAKLMELAGTTPKPRNKLVKDCVELGHGVIVAGWARQWNDQEMVQLAKIANNNNPTVKTIQLAVQWEKFPHMSEILENRQEISRRLLYSGKASVYEIKQARRRENWTQEEADEYIVKFLWPQWRKNPQTAQTDLAVAASDDMTQDKVPLLLKASPKAWEKTIFAERFAQTHLRFLEELDDELSDYNLRLKVQIPNIPEKWKKAYLRHLGKKIGNNSMGSSQAYLKHSDELLLEHLENQLIEDIQKGAKIPWDDVVGLTLADTYRASNIKLLPKVAKALGRRLDKDPTDTPQIKIFVNQMTVDLYWLQNLELKQLEQKLPGWLAGIDEKLGSAAFSEKTAFHNQVSQLLLERIDEAQSKGRACPELTRAFWHHFISGGTLNCRGVAKIALDLVDRDKTDQVWNIGKVEGLGDLTRAQIEAAAKKGKPTPDRKAALQKTLLTLSVLVEGKLALDDQAKAEASKPKM